MMVSLSYAQENYQIQFQDGSVTIPENIQTFQWDQMPEYAQYQGGYFGWVQFYETPTQDIQDLFKAQDLKLIQYLPQKTYLFYFPRAVETSFLAQHGVRSIVPAEGQYKLSQTLKTGDVGDHAIQGDHYLVTLQHYAWIDSNEVIANLATKQIAVAQQYKGSNNIDLLIPNNCLQELSNLPYVKWVEEIVAPDVKDDTRGKSLHRSNGLDTQTPGGQNYTGVGIGVMVRDDGIVGPHIDFQGRIDNSLASGSGQTHGDGVAGIMAGAGNLNPTYRGMAAGSNVFVVNYAANFLDTPTQTFINNGDVQITNSSYSNGCNAGYTTITQTVDQQTIDIPSLLHVFSAGNSNNNNCGYGAGTQWGNITGGHKQGKNVIATANVFYDGVLVNSSSRGPAHDGRIKPDIAANGQNQISTDEDNGYLSFGGTSGAAPGIAGISAQLYELYGDLNGGDLPPSALIKASLLTTANDYGNVGPDYKFGWGIVNGNRAGKLLQDGRYLDDNVSQGNSNTHSIVIPANTVQVRFMLYWSDVAASPGAAPSLVNDLDLVVTDPGNGDHLPWVLDHTPDPVLLDLPATQGEDHLNNMEQVLINAPAAGTYDLEVTGFNVPTGPQEYFIVYEVIEDNLTLTYPNDGEHFVPGETETIHWDAVNTAADFTLEYSTDNGGSWNAIDTVDGDETNYDWSVPNTISGEVLVRISSGSYEDESDDVFSIASLVSGFNVLEVCIDNATFSWDAVANAESYDFYILGDQYMEVVGTSNTNSITVPIPDANDPIWYAAVAKNDTEGWEGRRSVAILYDDGLFNCALNNNLTLMSINNGPGDFTGACGSSGDGIVSITVRNTGIEDQSNFALRYTVNGGAPVEETYSDVLAADTEIVYEFATPLIITENGSYTLVTEVDLAGDEYDEDDSQELSFNAQIDGTATPFLEPFDVNGFLPNEFWSIENDDDDITWEANTALGTGNEVTLLGWIDNYSYNAPGEEDVVVTEILDMTLISGASLSFDLAKAQYSATLFDGLRVEISTDCGVTFTTIYDKTDLELSTIPDYNTTNDWTPGSVDDWRVENIDLEPFPGDSAIFRFVNINGYGNSTYIDNINVSGVLATGEIAQFELGLQPNPANDQVRISFGAERPQVNALVVYNNLGQVVLQLDETQLNEATDINLDVSTLTTGMYFVKLEADGQQVTKKLLVR